MKKTVILSIIAAAAAAICSLFTVSCNKTIEEGSGHLWTEYRIDSMKGKKAVFVRDCPHCGKSGTYTAAPSQKLEYTENESGELFVSGIGKCKDEFLYIPSADESGRKISGISDNAFDGNDFIKYVYISDGIEYIGDYSFISCSSLLSVRLPENIKYLGIYAFYESTSLYAVNIPGSVEEIGEYLFGGCFSLRDITIPDRIVKIGNGAFSRCRSISEITLPENCRQIGKYCFDDCARLEKISLGNIGSIPEGAFSACIKLRMIELPSSVKSIESKVFIGCPMLERIYLPIGVENIGVVNGESPFYLCDYEKLKVYCGASEPPISWSKGFDVCNYYPTSADDEELKAEFVYGYTVGDFRNLLK